MHKVLIVGGGLTGATIAYELGRNGVPCVVLEREPVPGGLVRSEHMGASFTSRTAPTSFTPRTPRSGSWQRR